MLELVLNTPLYVKYTEVYLEPACVKLLLSKVMASSWKSSVVTYLAFTCSKLAIETLEQGVKYVQS